jgi:hypothetical protein
MRNRAVRGLLALGTVLALLFAVPATTASAEDGTTHLGDRVCGMYVNSNGFGAYCSNAAGGVGEKPTWRQLMTGPLFIPCRDYPVPAGIQLGPLPDGKKVWKLRLTIVGYNLDEYDGGKDAHLERAIVPLSQQELDECPVVGYMDIFWHSFDESYPDPVLQVNPTYIPRVNVPAFFSLTRDSSYIQKNEPVEGADVDSIYYGDGHNLTMRGVVASLTIDPGDGSKPFDCLMGVVPIDGGGYDRNSDPFHQMNTCKYVYKRSSANQPDGMYTIKLTLHWQVDYWRSFTGGWEHVGMAEVHAVQRLPVQEVQAIGGGDRPAGSGGG